MADDDPTAEMAAAIARRVSGAAPVAVRRFTTGSQHFVFEAVFSAREPLVVRLSRPAHRWLAEAALALSRQLRPLGVPLPEVLAADTAASVPYLVLERLPGTDLGAALPALDRVQRAGVAEAVAATQAIVVETPSAGRYGYAAKPEAAPFDRWSEVPHQNLKRSRQRIEAAGLFDLLAIERAELMLDRVASEADRQAALPFLHDTTSKNVIVAADGRFSGVVDVDDLCFGDPRWVVALTLASLLASGHPQDYVARWMEVAGHADDRLFRLYVALFLLDFMSEHGQVFNGNERPSDSAARQRLLALFEAQMALAGG